jgi:hypothetical protein
VNAAITIPPISAASSRPPNVRYSLVTWSRSVSRIRPHENGVDTGIGVDAVRVLRSPRPLGVTQ